MTWNDQLSVGVNVVDDDHRKLVSMANNLYDGIVAGHGKEELGTILDGLVDYTRFHFAREEELFARTSYGLAAEHKREHDKLTSQVMDVQARYRRGSSALTLEVMVFLKDWLYEHILVSDKRYGPYMNDMGIF